MAALSWIVYFCWFPVVIISSSSVRQRNCCFFTQWWAAKTTLSGPDQIAFLLITQESGGRQLCPFVDGPTNVLMHSDVLHHTHHNVCLQLPTAMDNRIRRLCLWPHRRVALVPSVTDLHTNIQTPRPHPQHPVLQDYTVSAEICLSPRHTSRQAYTVTAAAQLRCIDETA